VEYRIRTETFCSLPSCFDIETLTDFDRFRFIPQKEWESTVNVIERNVLTITTYYPKKPRYDRDYQYETGKSVTSKGGTIRYTHEGEEISRIETYENSDIFNISSEVIPSYGLYNNLFDLGPETVKYLFSQFDFHVYEEGEFMVGASEGMEVAINFKDLIFEMRYFTEKQLEKLMRIECIRTDKDKVVPLSETNISYDVLPSNNDIRYQITQVKTYLFYQITDDKNEVLVSVGEDKDDKEMNPEGTQKNIQLDQYEEINKREMNLKVYPNPAGEQITITFPFYMNDNVQIDLLNSMGVVLLSQQHSSGDRIDMDIRLLPAGVYVVRCIRNQKTITTRFVKQ
jgi:hypothetical protein